MKSGVIKEDIIRYPNGSEWMVGKNCNIIEEYQEDGEPWYVVEIVVPSAGARLFKMPARYVVVDQTPEQVKAIVAEEPKAENLKEVGLDGRCHHITKLGKRCKAKTKDMYCHIHAKKYGSNS